ncbi:hypothetical protein HOI18_01135 [Candidatus Uhrbacteria bacterium]|nr:hypothetical protein [Candidatus Uhrbacteria bacterium]
MPSKPVRLRPIQPKHKAALWVGVTLSVLVIAVSWGMVIKDVLRSDVLQIQAQMSTIFDRAAEGIVDISAEANEVVSPVRENIDIFKETYDAEIERQRLEETTN